MCYILQKSPYKQVYYLSKYISTKSLLLRQRCLLRHRLPRHSAVGADRRNLRAFIRSPETAPLLLIDSANIIFEAFLVAHNLLFKICCSIFSLLDFSSNFAINYNSASQISLHINIYPKAGPIAERSRASIF